MLLPISEIPQGVAIYNPPSFNSWTCTLSLYIISIQSRTPKNTRKASFFVCLVSWQAWNLRSSFSPFQALFLFSFPFQEQNNILSGLFLGRFFPHLSGLRISQLPGLRPELPPHGGSLRSLSHNPVFSWTEILGMHCFLVHNNDSLLNWSNHRWWFD